jgi:uncharacterized protein (TIGR02757 family)
MAGLRETLLDLYDACDHAARIPHDPVSFPRAWPRREDAEIAGLIAAQLAFGRVSLFLPVIRAFLDAAGPAGPRAFIEGFTAADRAKLAGLRYRWMRGDDFVLLAETLRGVFSRWPDLESVFAAHHDGPTVIAALDGAVCELGRLALETPLARSRGVKDIADLPRGFRYFLTAPRGGRGSACKRWNLYLRWMVRPATEGVDLGLWTAIRPAALVIPLDTHVARLARFTGLTTRKDSSWRTAEAITASLRVFDAQDPVRFDFALAHLGISGACAGHRAAAICATCPLDAVCRAT